jgi:hypothetical protein
MELNQQLNDVFRPLLTYTPFIIVLGIFLSLYFAMEAKYMPKPIINFVNNSYGKLIIILFIIFIGTRDIYNSKLIALFLMTIFLIILHYTNEKQIKEEYYNIEYNNTNLLKQIDTFTNVQPLCDLNIKNNKNICNSHIPSVIEDEEIL